jgi:hypothetical protein
MWIFQILGQALAAVQPLLELGMGDVAADDDLPDSSRRVATGYWVSVARIVVHGLVQVDGHGIVSCALGSGQENGPGSVSSCSRKMPLW